MPHCVFSTFFHNRFIAPFERDLLANCKALRVLFEHMINKRRELISKDPEAAAKKGDLLCILLRDDLFN